MSEVIQKTIASMDRISNLAEKSPIRAMAHGGVGQKVLKSLIGLASVSEPSCAGKQVAMLWDLTCQETFQPNYPHIERRD